MLYGCSTNQKSSCRKTLNNNIPLLLHLDFNSQQSCLTTTLGENRARLESLVILSTHNIISFSNLGILAMGILFGADRMVDDQLYLFCGTFFGPIK